MRAAPALILAILALGGCRDIAGYGPASSERTGVDLTSEDAPDSRPQGDDGALASADASADASLDLLTPDRTPDLLSADSLSPDTFAGAWYSVDKARCGTWCAGQGMGSAPGPETARCASGEVRPQSYGATKLGYKYGCFNGCAPLANSGVANADTNVLGYCYADGQTWDNDKTDIAIACFCR